MMIKFDSRGKLTLQPSTFLVMKGVVYMGDSGRDHGEDEESPGQIKHQIMLPKLLLVIPARMESI